MSRTAEAESKAKQTATSGDRVLFWVSVLTVYGVLVAAIVAGSHFREERLVGAALLAFVVIGWLQYVIIQAMHEACHQTKRGFASWAAAALLFYPIGLTRAYRKIHFAHHRSFNSELDPDYPAYVQFPKSRSELLGTLLKHASGWAAAHQLVEQNLGDTGQKHTEGGVDRFMMPLSQLGILAAFTLLSSPIDYVLFWIAPLVTVGKVLGYLRILTEHGDPARGPMLRSFRCGTIAGLILGPYGFVRHAEHHARMNVPFSSLGDLVRESDVALIEAYAQRHASDFEVFDGSHFRLLRVWWRLLPNRSDAN